MDLVKEQEARLARERLSNLLSRELGRELQRRKPDGSYEDAAYVTLLSVTIATLTERG